MKAIPIELPDTLEQVEIVPFWDLHIGSTKCRYQEVKRRIEYVRTVPHAYAILGGDLMNNSTCDSVGDTYSEVITPQQQIDKTVELFTPIKDKILGMCAGNHEARTLKKCGIDIAQCAAAQLGIIDRYDTTSGLIFLSFGKRTTYLNQDGTKNKHQGDKISYTIYFCHGTGNGGRLIGSKVNGTERRADIVDADIIMQGHTHQPFIAPSARLVVDRVHKTFNTKYQWLVNADATLNYEEYAETVGMRPSATINPRLILSGHTQAVVALMR